MSLFDKLSNKCKKNKCTSDEVYRCKKVEITTTNKGIFEGTEFAVGQYEQILGVIYFEINPDHPLNKKVNFLDKAERNKDGFVEYSCTFDCTRPMDSSRGNGILLCEVPNRGRRILSYELDGPPLSSGSGADGWFNGPGTIANGSLGTGWMYNQGYTFLWIGWEPGMLYYLLPANKFYNLYMTAPQVKAESRQTIYFSAIGDDNVNITPDNGSVKPLGSFTAPLFYPTTSLDVSTALLTVREYPGDAPQQPLELSFKFENASGIANNSIVHVIQPSTGLPGFDAGAIYEFTYNVANPYVVGLGFTALRDGIDAIKKNTNLLDNTKRRLLTGFSQAARYIRSFLHLGYNIGSNYKKVYHGMLPIGAGALKVAIEDPWGVGYMFLQHQENGQAYNEMKFPFSYATVKNKVGNEDGKIDSLFYGAKEAKFCDDSASDSDSNSKSDSFVTKKKNCNPKVIAIEGASEQYNKAVSLLWTDTQGKDIKNFPKNFRMWQIAGGEHAYLYITFPATYIENPENILNWYPILRCALISLGNWVNKISKPAPSLYPSHEKKTLVPFLQQQIGFPNIPGVTYTGDHFVASQISFKQQPPVKGYPYPSYVCKNNSDGNEIDGIIMPEITVPIGTYTGWNYYVQGFAKGALCAEVGSFLVFPKTLADRILSGDPRPSLAERYQSVSDPTGVTTYTNLITTAANALVAKGYILQNDVSAIVTNAVAQYVTAST